MEKEWHGILSFCWLLPTAQSVQEWVVGKRLRGEKTWFVVMMVAYQHLVWSLETGAVYLDKGIMCRSDDGCASVWQASLHNTFQDLVVNQLHTWTKFHWYQHKKVWERENQSHSQSSFSWAFKYLHNLKMSILKEIKALEMNRSLLK